MSLADSFIYWCASKPEEDDVGFENEIPLDEETERICGDNMKGKARESMYVSLVEGTFFLHITCYRCLTS